MKTAFDSEIEKQIRRTVKLGNPWALDGLTMGAHGEDRKLAGEFGEIVVDEYRRRLSAMPREKMRELYHRCYEEPTYANKDWLLGEIVESIEAGGN